VGQQGPHPNPPRPQHSLTLAGEETSSCAKCRLEDSYLRKPRWRWLWAMNKDIYFEKEEEMTTRLATLTRPASGVDWRQQTSHRKVGFGLALVGLMLVTVTLIINLVVAGDLGASSALSNLRLSFGLTTLAFGTIKIGIAVVLVGILIRLWHRVDSVKAALPGLKAEGDGTVQTGAIKTAFGPANVGVHTPNPHPIHRMAQTMWAPMLAMGAMALGIGTAVSFAWAGNETDVALGAWTQGLQFLGEALLLSGIAMLLGSTLRALREGGGSVQESLGLGVVTLKMPVTAKIFVFLMATGLMLGIAQFIGHIVVAGGVDQPAAWFAWLGPLRELSLGLILAGIVMALVTIGNVLAFQFNRICQIIATGM